MDKVKTEFDKAKDPNMLKSLSLNLDIII
jgi:hypothetical protein